MCAPSWQQIDPETRNEHTHEEENDRIARHEHEVLEVHHSTAWKQQRERKQEKQQ